ncbi:MAG TPA: ABC transporter ATP-binding protein [Kofleriaceae bacterium]|nr:ABC transporter ATP-binding protein [Kofleriaceae bacterium]
MIELQDITKVYRTIAGPHIVLDHINTKFPPLQAIGILGRNGAGKSTLLRIIGGAEAPTAGKVVRHSRVSWPIGFAAGFNISLSGDENCRFVARIYAQDIVRVTEETREFADLGNYFYMPVRTYSSGMRARLAFGLSMAIPFDIYLVDEITAVGDKSFRGKCRRVFEERRQRAGLIMVSHDIPVLKEHCKRCALIDRGRLTIYDSVDEAAEAYEATLAA